jgi:NADH:ubiquinone oxidoreductase subunit 6 (subunit J)
LFFGSVYFLVIGLMYTRIANHIQKITGHSDRTKSVGIAIMKPMAFVFAIASLSFAFFYFFQ